MLGTIYANISRKSSVDAAGGSKLSGYRWEQSVGMLAELGGADSDTLSVTLVDAAAYNAALRASLEASDCLGVQAIKPQSF